MNHKALLIKLYYLLVHADGKVNEHEVALGKQMIHTEGITESEFIIQLESVKKRNHVVVQAECIEELKKLNHEKQVHSIAWLCVIANADGFMDKTEWQFIYKLYSKELNLTLDEIMKVQKELIGLKEKPVMGSSIIA